MKKTFYIFSLILSVIVSFGMYSCSCNKEKNDFAQVQNDTTLVVETTVNLDKQVMFNEGKDYVWYETCVLLKDYLDDEKCDGTVAEVTNIFQVNKNGQPYVWMFTHVGDSLVTDVHNSFWMEDYRLNDDHIKLTYKDAFNKVMSTNSVKPHSRNCILRNPMGPLECNPQYVFGNIEEQLWVDAVTGDVHNSNPAFPVE